MTMIIFLILFLNLDDATEEEIKAEKEKKKAEKRKKREEWKKNNPLSRAWRKVAKAATDLVSPEGE